MKCHNFSMKHINFFFWVYLFHFRKTNVVYGCFVIMRSEIALCCNSATRDCYYINKTPYSGGRCWCYNDNSHLTMDCWFHFNFWMRPLHRKRESSYFTNLKEDIFTSTLEWPCLATFFTGASYKTQIRVVKSHIERVSPFTTQNMQHTAKFLP